MDINPERKKDWGRRLEVYWEGDGVFYRGTVTAYSVTSRKHTVVYDDGELERVNLDEVSPKKLALENCKRDVPPLMMVRD
jgi:hypothetical protein